MSSLPWGGHMSDPDKKDTVSMRVDIKAWRRENLTRWQKVKTVLGFRTPLPEGWFWRG